MAQIPARQVQGDDRERLRNLRAEIAGAVFGQDEAVDRLVTAIQIARAGLRDRERPVGSFLLTGPTGVGKTEKASPARPGARYRLPALRHERLHGEAHGVAPRGRAARLRRLRSRRSAHRGGGQELRIAVLLLDEIEKAHEDVFNLLLQVMDHGTLTDANGKRTDFRHVILLMTSNVGAC